MAATTTRAKRPSKLEVLSSPTGTRRQSGQRLVSLWQDGAVSCCRRIPHRRRSRMATIPQGTAPVAHLSFAGRTPSTSRPRRFTPLTIQLEALCVGPSVGGASRHAEQTIRLLTDGTGVRSCQRRLMDHRRRGVKLDLMIKWRFKLQRYRGSSGCGAYINFPINCAREPLQQVKT
jgi:hypothetical protein